MEVKISTTALIPLQELMPSSVPICRQKADGRNHQPCIHRWTNPAKPIISSSTCGTCACTCPQTPATYPKCI